MTLDIFILIELLILWNHTKMFNIYPVLLTPLSDLIRFPVKTLCL